MHNALFVSVLRNEYGAALQMLTQALETCPAELWNLHQDEFPLWQQAFHVLWYADLYLSFAPEPFENTLGDREIAGFKVTPEGPLSRPEMLAYAVHVRAKADAVLDWVTDEALGSPNERLHWSGPTLAHRLAYNVRHVQHHIGEINSFLTRHGAKGPDWVIAPKPSR
jgi:hypothetical protein